MSSTPNMNTELDQSLNLLSGFSAHFLSLPRPDPLQGPLHGVVDTTTLAAHDFDVDNRTGFMPPQPPVERLPVEWDDWESCLNDAIQSALQLGDKPNLSEEEAQLSKRWRESVKEMKILPTDGLKSSELLLRRAHLVLAWILHFYVHTLPPSEAVIIPPPLTLPLLQVSQQLVLPPVLTYSDDVLYNWALKTPSSDPTPALDNLRCNTLFTSTNDEQEFYLVSARMEIRGTEALELMRLTMDELFVGDDIAIKRVTGYLNRITTVLHDLKNILLSVKEGCDPYVFYHQVRPWFRGMDSSHETRKWVFDGLELDPSLSYPEELSGPSAGQSALIHALDIFLGVNRYSHSSSITGAGDVSEGNNPAGKAFLTRMQCYMPRHHRNFLNHLTTNPRPLRDAVEASQDAQMLEAYNSAVLAMKALRDAHLVIVSQYIIIPSRKEQAAASLEQKPLKGTGGSNLVKFLKDVRNSTADAVIQVS